MKNLLSLFTITIFLVTNTACAQSQNENDKIVSMLREFYLSYNAVWENFTSYTLEEFEDKMFSLQQKYCSIKLQNKIKKYYRIYKFDHDLLTNDYGGTDMETFEQTLSIVQDTTKKYSYMVSYIVNIGYPSITRTEKNVINLTVVKEDGIYKIDEVW